MITQTKPAATNQTNQTPQTRGNGIANPTPGAQPVQPAANVAPETKPAPILEMHEAPYSWNVKAVSPEGFEELFTVRAVTLEGFTQRVMTLKGNLLDLGYKPAPTRGASASAAPLSATANAAADANAAPLCGIHGTPMEWRETKRGAFWSCPQKFANGDWCNYKAPKQ